MKSTVLIFLLLPVAWGLIGLIGRRRPRHRLTGIHRGPTGLRRNIQYLSGGIPPPPCANANFDDSADELIPGSDYFMNNRQFRPPSFVLNQNHRTFLPPRNLINGNPNILNPPRTSNYPNVDFSRNLPQSQPDIFGPRFGNEMRMQQNDFPPVPHPMPYEMDDGHPQPCFQKSLLARSGNLNNNEDVIVTEEPINGEHMFEDAGLVPMEEGV